MRKYPGQSERIKEFTEIVCSCVKSKWAHNLLSYELGAHIDDRKTAYINAGIDKFTAEERAIEDMGDPAVIGGQFNRIHRYRKDLLPNIIMWIIAGIFAFAGTVSGIILFFISFMGEAHLLSALGLSFILFSWLIAFSFITVWKVAEDMFLGYTLIKDYKRRRAKLNGKS